MGQSFKLIGAPCAHRGPYTFYKAFKYTKNDITNIITINEFFFVKLWNDSDLISIGELRLLWEDKNCNIALASLRLYILPENTPDGRISDVHGEDEVLAITEKVVIKLEDLLTWITEATNWSWGLDSIWRTECISTREVPSLNGGQCVNDDHNEPKNTASDSISENSLTLVDCSAIDYADINEDKQELDKLNWDIRTGVIVLSYARYCRYRGLLKRLEGVHDKYLRNRLVSSLGGFYTSCRTTKILFCKDTFDYPDLEGHELLCNHLAPKLRSRLPKRKKMLYPSPEVSETDSASNSCSEDERISSSASSTNSRISFAASRPTTSTQKKPPNLLPLPIDDSIQITAVDELKKQKAFTQNLHAFMRARLTPIGKLPYIGNREINLFEFYNKVKMLGGYVVVTNNKLWKFIFETLGGDNSSAATAAIIKKHYEKYLLPYEQHLAQQFRQTNVNQLLVRQQPAEVRKSQLTITATDYDRRRLMSTAKPAQSLIQRMLPNGKPGDKENIPLSQKRLLMGRPEVVDLRETEVGNPSRSAPSAHQQRASSSAVVTDITDLCTDSPIRRSVPPIAATLTARKRKLDILREGGLEVTPITSTFGSAVEPDVVTITKTITIDSDEGGSRSSPFESASIEILDPKKYASSNDGYGSNHNRPKSSSQILDLIAIRASNGTMEDNLIKRISPSLGPNIEISIVPNDESRDPKKRKSVQLPIPALRKISTGELSVKNLSMKMNEAHRNSRPKAAMTSKRMDMGGLSAKDLRPSVSISVTEKSPFSTAATSLGFPANMNESLYSTAAMYSAVQSAAQSNEYFNEDMMAASSYQHPLSFLAGSFLQQLQQQQQLHYQQQSFNNGSSKNNGVSSRKNNEQILPD